MKFRLLFDNTKPMSMTIQKFNQNIFSKSHCSGTNDVYATIELGKERFQTSVQEKCETPAWHEECLL